MTAPKEDSVKLVNEWLEKEISNAKVSVTGDYFTVEGTVNEIEKLLKTKYSTYGTMEPLYFPNSLSNLNSERGNQSKGPAYA